MRTLCRCASRPFAAVISPGRRLQTTCVDGPRSAMQVLGASNSENVAMEPPAKQARVAPSDPEVFRVQRISAAATLPVRGSTKAAGYDIARCARGCGSVPRAVRTGMAAGRPGCQTHAPAGFF